MADESASVGTTYGRITVSISIIGPDALPEIPTGPGQATAHTLPHKASSQAHACEETLVGACDGLSWPCQSQFLMRTLYD